METRPTPHTTAVAYYQCEFNECCVLCPYNEIQHEEGCLEALRRDVLDILQKYDEMHRLELKQQIDISEDQPTLPGIEEPKGDIPLEDIADFIKKPLEGHNADTTVA